MHNIFIIRSLFFNRVLNYYYRKKYNSFKALEINLNPQEIKWLDEAFPEGIATGTRYAEPMMSHLDSEKG